MAEIRAVVTVPVTAQFAGLGAPTPASPFCYVDTNGDVYVLITPDQVVKIGSVAGGADSIIASQVFGQHVVNHTTENQRPQTRIEYIPTPVVSDFLRSRSFGQPQLPARWT